MKFSWRDDKAEEVRKKHAIEFMRITDIFADPFAVEFIDESHSTEEEIRYAIIGATVYGLVFLVFTEIGPDELHFISARLAEKWMVKEYEQNRKRY